VCVAVAVTVVACAALPALRVRGLAALLVALLVFCVMLLAEQLRALRVVLCEQLVDPLAHALFVALQPRQAEGAEGILTLVEEVAMVVKVQCTLVDGLAVGAPNHLSRGHGAAGWPLACAAESGPVLLLERLIAPRVGPLLPDVLPPWGWQGAQGVQQRRN
jgi:hypothetical protein